MQHYSSVLMDILGERKPQNSTSHCQPGMADNTYVPRLPYHEQLLRVEDGWLTLYFSVKCGHKVGERKISPFLEVLLGLRRETQET